MYKDTLFYLILTFMLYIQLNGQDYARIMPVRFNGVQLIRVSFGYHMQTFDSVYTFLKFAE